MQLGARIRLILFCLVFNMKRFFPGATAWLKDLTQYGLKNIGKPKNKLVKKNTPLIPRPIIQVQEPVVDAN
jgi:hypothetical protein